MRKHKLLACAAASLICGSLLAGCGAKADTIVYGDIYTGESDAVDAQAMVIKDGEIIYVGDKEGAEKYEGGSVDIADYTDQFIMPGIIDGHCHPYISAENSICDFDVSDCANADECIDVISEYVAKNPKDFYVGYGWLDVMFENGRPTSELLDAIDTDAPIYLKSEDCHSAWTNTAMTNLCGVTKDTLDPNGGRIERDDEGNPVGCYRDTAMDVLIKPFVPVYSVEEYKEILLTAQDEKLSLGYTGYNDVLIDEASMDNIVEAYRQLDEEGKLTAYVNAACVINNNEDALERLAHIKELSDTASGDHFRLNDVKIFMDGITESCTSYMIDPYPGKGDYRGVDRWSGEESTQRLYDLATGANDLGLVVHFHAIGDAAVRKALDAAEYARNNSIDKEVRNVITHAEFVNEEDYPRFAELGVILSADFGWGSSSSPELEDNPNYVNIERTNVGDERVDNETPYASIMHDGAATAFATDVPATAVGDPFMALQIGATRHFAGIEGTEINPKEKITVSEGIKAMTAGGAYQLYREEEYGTLSVGKRANFLVLGDDLTQMDPELIATVELVESYIDGESVLDK